MSTLASVDGKRLGPEFPTVPLYDDHHHQSREYEKHYWKKFGLFGCGILGAWLVLIFWFIFLLCIYQRKDERRVRDEQRRNHNTSEDVIMAR